MADSTKKLQDLGAEVAAQGSSEAIRALRDELLALGGRRIAVTDGDGRQGGAARAEGGFER